MKRRITSLMLAVSLLLSAVPTPAFATEESNGLCEHHAVHTEECGYASTVEAQDCGHVHSDDCQKSVVHCVHEHGDECWQPSVDGGDPVLECAHTECTVQSGCVAADIFCVHQHGDECWQIGEDGEEPVLNCIHTECTVESGCATVKLVCNHAHDASCGYTEGSAEVPCSYECEICNSIEAGFCAHGNGIESCELCQLETLIDSLPTYEELGTLEGDAYTEAISDVQEAQVTYYGLSAEQQAQVQNADVLLTLLNGPEDQPSTTPDGSDGDIDGGDISWILDEQGVLTISGVGDMNCYDTHTNKAPWYDYREEILTVIIDEGITSIGDCSFYNCKKLTKVIIPNSVTEIKYYAFYSCKSLTDVNISDYVTSIGEDAFTLCISLADLTIGSSVTTIGPNAFYKCNSLTDVTIPDSVTSIGRYAFSWCV
ncbi:MAG: leucine-rich repeat domain-containing protein, partial [Eubacteriales bacterium]|nr:leucine-rich repeat domain-containing protein [Eubacteriales bacterium]